MTLARWPRFRGAMILVLLTASCREPPPPPIPGAAPVPAALRAAYVAAVQGRAADGYRFAPTAEGFHAESAAQGLRADLRARGVEVSGAAGRWAFQAAPSRWGCDGALAEVTRVAPEMVGARATYRRDGFDEWYVNGALGLEQGFTLAAPPCRKVGGARVVIELGGGLAASLAGEGEAAALRDASGREVLHYTDLHVVDAAGKELPAGLTTDAGRLALWFEDREATYPVTVDPLMWVPQAELTAGDGASLDYFGYSVAVDGDTAVVGAYGNASEQGAAYVFVGSGSSWSQQAELTAGDGTAGDRFGISVAVSGDTAVVGAYERAQDQGAAYVFVRSGSSWSQQGELTASDGASLDYFGASVAVSGDTAIVGAYGHASGQGAAYVFTAGSAWSQQQELTASDGVAPDRFGVSVAMSGTTAVVGAYQRASSQGAAYVFVSSSSSWSQQAELTASDGVAGDSFGRFVALSGGTAIFAAPAKASKQGAAYVFSGAGSSWSQQAELTASDGVAGDQFGGAVAVNGGTAVVGANEGGTAGQGAAYVFVGSGSTWSQQQELTASDGAQGDQFGGAAAVFGETVFVDAFEHASGQGTAYVFLPPGAPGAACSQSADCASGFCVEGVCCDKACTGLCDACSAAQTVSGTAGTCGPKILSCPPPGACQYAGTCDPNSGGCGNVSLPDGSVCESGASAGVCIAGACILDSFSSSASTGTSSGSSGAAGTGGAAGASSSASTGTTRGSGGAPGGTGSGGSGGSGSPVPIQLQGNGCSTGRSPGGEGGWLLLGLLLASRRRCRGRGSPTAPPDRSRRMAAVPVGATLAG